MSEKDARYGLVGDIGGTNARFALVELGGDAPIKLIDRFAHPCADYPTMDEAVEAYLARYKGDHRVDGAVIAVAGAVTDGRIHLTNSNWEFDAKQSTKRFGVGEFELTNDYTALSLSLHHLTDSDRAQIGGGAGYTSGDFHTYAVIGAGTGLGVGGAVHGPHGVCPLMTEGGHTTFAPTTDFERELDRVLRAEFGRVSNERLLSGPGLTTIHSALAKIDGRSAEPELAPAKVTEYALSGADDDCVRALNLFCEIYGAFAGDVALTMGARAGVYVAGGIAPRILSFMEQSKFRARFEAKGRFHEYMEPIPVWVITHPYAALLGAAEMLRNRHNPVSSLAGDR